MFEGIRLKVNDDVVSRTVHGEEVVLDLIHGHYFGLNEVGTRIWNDLKSGHTLEDSTQSVMDEYDVSEETLQKDVQSWLEALKSKGLIEIQN